MYRPLRLVRNAEAQPPPAGGGERRDSVVIASSYAHYHDGRFVLLHPLHQGVRGELYRGLRSRTY
jgi:hypothetical protein